MSLVSLIAAMDRNRVIGAGNALPWHLPEDLAHFKSITMGKPIVMGRKTWESIGRALPGRRNIVISRQANYVADGAELAHSVMEALTRVPSAAEVVVMGGATIYQQALPLVNKMYLTMIDMEVDGDAWFPEYSAKDWSVVQCSGQLQSANNKLRYEFIDLVRKSSGLANKACTNPTD